MCKKTNYHGTSNTRIDKCMRPLIKFLQDRDYKTVACCCGHDKYPMTVVVEYVVNGEKRYHEILSDRDVLRNRRFYKKDKEGYYYIPESLPICRHRGKNFTTKDNTNLWYCTECNIKRVLT